MLEERLSLLRRITFSFDDRAVVVGCSLWSLISVESALAVKAVVDDFKKIQGWGIEDHNAVHCGDLA